MAQGQSITGPILLLRVDSFVTYPLIIPRDTTVRYPSRYFSTRAFYLRRGQVHAQTMPRIETNIDSRESYGFSDWTPAEDRLKLFIAQRNVLHMVRDLFPNYRSSPLFHGKEAKSSN